MEFKDVPEFFEVELGECLTARTETLSSFKELGPPDLCQVVKSSGKSGQKDIGSYHYISGVDASTSASLAAYLNSLTYAVEDTSTWFAKAPVWKVRSGSYCCYNAFSRVDMRVDVKIPGGVHAYVIDIRGERHEPTPELWQETYLSAILRAILYADDPNYRLIGYRKLDPITTRESEVRFLQAAEALFQQGWQLGCDPEIQVASIVSNHLTTGIMKYFGDGYRLSQAANLFEKLLVRTPDVAALLAKSYMGMNEEVKAVQILSQAIRDSPQSFILLHVQCDFLRQKEQFEWALKIAQQAVNCAPSEFVTWAKLTEIYIDLGQYDSALLTLNSCPMFTYNDRDLHRMPTPNRTHLPIKQFIADSQILDNDGVEEDTDPALLRLPAPALRGTFAKAYELLCRLVSDIGWDELLKTRSAVFVMEEEYRNQKAQLIAEAMEKDMKGKRADQDDDDENDNDDGTGPELVGESLATAKQPRAPDADDDDASTRGMMSPSAQSSSMADGDLSVQPPGDGDDDEEPRSAQGGTTNGTKKNGFAQGMSNINKPTKAAASDADEGEDQDRRREVSGEANTLNSKRLCERWLDNMFMCLYEDLRVWTIFRAEVAHFKNHRQAYRKTGSEWEILGDLGTRLLHREEAKEAYQRSLDIKFSAKAWMRLLEIYAEESDLQRTLNAAIRLTAYQHRWYFEMAFPTAVAHQLFKLGRTHGHAKISFTLLSMGLPDGIRKIVEHYLSYGKTFQIEGYEF
ncbi:hypothetical protein FRC16_003521 [Serendipita sp. 398]|nr:hypothetical protein FRC16_003521 [Serendipita sp. 398]